MKKIRDFIIDLFELLAAFAAACIIIYVIFSSADFLKHRIAEAPTYIVILGVIAVIWLIREVRNGNKNKHDN